MTIKAGVFDIGNVLIEWQPEHHYDRWIGEARRKAMFAEVDLHAMNERVDKGENWRDVIYETADLYPKWRDEILAWHSNWIALASPVIPHSVHLLRALRAKGVPVFALTNFGVENFAYAQTIYAFLNEFDQCYVSGRMKLIKPDPNIYEAMEADCGVAADALLFADDKSENIAAAKARGWNTHLFETPDGWARCLVQHGLLTSQEASA
ncbi:MAG: HAD family phosphatase [Pseudomonadota bacterium]